MTVGIDATLLVLAKSPVAGRVKTRLCPPCTPFQAAAIARAAIVDTLDVARSLPRVRPVLVLDGEPGPWILPGVAVIPQTGGDLADRLGGAFGAVDGPTALIGMDTPQLTTTLLGAAVAALRSPKVDAILGRTIDGGWWIIGLQDPHLRAFDGVPMSSSTTGHAQAARLATLGLRTRALSVEMDVDTFADARTVANRIPHSRFAGAVHTAAREIAFDHFDAGVPA